ncbi:ABC-type branched-subunit amino acid transport system substrate-binding protein [Sphingomonas jejuensis]|uniref:ABC-type branched-subunit amino acid transport system substrate-binding protein n=2 Tax=Sphingomonas jejuensis TaxID=904715 RepID=A0ABX0XID3_9SPHN|nr:ABC-type branched-subunit amino acid transport system substrate-binding protein [Sphingomonas jejuensis]
MRGMVFAASALLLAGCQTIVPRGPTPAPDERPPVTTPAPRPTTPTPGLPQDQDRHRIALLVPLSGSNAGVGQSLANAANLALLDANSTRVRITTYDTAPGAAGAAQRAIAEGARLILGPLLSTDVRAAAPIAARAGVPIVSFSNDVSVAGDGTFVMGYSPSQSIDRVVRHARSRGITRFAALVPSGTYGQRASAAMIRSVEAAGGSVVSMENFDRSPASLRTAVGRLSPGYEALLIADGGRIAVQAVPLVRRGNGAEARILGTELWAAEADIGTNAALNGAWFAGVGNELYDQFARRYRARYSTAPYRIASLGYDATLLVERIARDWRVGTPFPVRELTDEGGFGGIDGAFRFGRDGTAERALVVYQVGQGTTQVISPAPARFDD